MRTKTSVMYVTTSLNYPIHRKRLASFILEGGDFHAIGFDQKTFEIISSEHSGATDNVTVLGQIEPGNYMNRACLLFKNIISFRKHAKKSDVVYASGFDAAALMLIATIGLRKKLVYEIHDIRQQMLNKNVIGSLFRLFEKYLVNRTDLLIVTSESYLENYYYKLLNASVKRSYKLENKLWPQDVCTDDIGHPPISPLVIGYFGLIRCNVTWNFLVNLVKSSRGSILLKVRGVAQRSITSFERDIEDVPWIEYGGPYNNPKDVFDMCRAVSMVWVAGYQQKDSYKWSRTCRFYQACCYGRPLIAQQGTYECETVSGLDIGVGIDLQQQDIASEQIKSITDRDIKKWYRNIIRLPASTYTYTNESTEILDMIENI
ncbi:hypothetical protein [Marinimicrobium sp. ABcell2]|uniref:hypothetical protein n=1 Tax=Marinimicrobium sp. ABcell2 TaxID=3069751 RepID=UPI0027B4A2CB|nr:hypothetical protein [Marinimicrobium sp. ABcell2]MDQ2075765.1 hypothetical protein [Marinimicrobium sp. ABcell2]